MSSAAVLQEFHPIVRGWFEETFGEPSPPQALGWPSISAGRHTLILAPTGSGKTLAAFLWAINHLVEQHLREDLAPGVRILYISPLKALNNDVERNLVAPLHGIREQARKGGLKLPAIHTAVRTGDTPQSKRISMIKHPPDILITTPESIYLMLTSKQARKMFTTVQYVIVDEIHSICSNKRGVHLSLSLERLARVAQQEFIRIGLSATQRPLELVASFLGGLEWNGRKLVPRPVAIVDAGERKTMDLRVECAVPDFSQLPQEGVWPLVFTELLELIKRHTTTLVFVNNRRLAERVAAKLNEMISGRQDTFNLYAVPVTLPAKQLNNPHEGSQEVEHNDLVQAYHGSMSRHAREQMETDLKEGKLRALVATSSLELGIDIGSIDLVVQLQSPKGTISGLQRVGRSGHLVHATSKGRILPTHREDLVEATVLARAMLDHDIEPTSIPADCLDVLAQQIVAMVSVENWAIDELYDLVRQSFCYRSLSHALYMGVIQMLAGRYTDAAFRELRARISWDKTNNTLRSLPGSSQLAITSGGTISDRGHFGVYLEDGKTKVGEVDEEFIYESRAGDTFILGSSVWRMVEIDAQRVTVAPAPGQPARMPFWRGEGVGRSAELGRKIGAFRRDIAARLDAPDCLQWLRSEFPIDASSAWNIREYFRRQRDATGRIPDDQLMAIEGFRDEIGDPRIIIHSPFGRRINGLLGLVAVRRLHEILKTTPQLLYNDDGILLRCSDVDELPLNFLADLSVREAEHIVLNDILSSPMFGGQFRQNAARALLMPKVAPGKRTPLWLQRLRAGDLLQIARQFDDFPIVIETVREVLNDVLEYTNFKNIIRKIEKSEIEIASIQTETPSPFAASMLFDFIAVYMYEWDQPREDRQSQYLSLNRELLSEVVDTESIASLLRPEAIDTVTGQLQRSSEDYKARSPEELHEFLLRLGDLTEEEIDQRCAGNAVQFIRELASSRRAMQINVGHELRWISSEEQETYASLGTDAQTSRIIHRYLQNRGPSTSESIAKRYSLDAGVVENLLVSEAEALGFVQGHFDKRTSEVQWCYRPTLERIHRHTLGILRKEISPCSLQDFTRFLFQWQHIVPEDYPTPAFDPLDCIGQLQALPLPAEIWERDILRARTKGISENIMDNIGASGSIVWIGRGIGKIACILRGEGSCFIDSPAVETFDALGTAAGRIFGFLKENGASFFRDIRSETALSLSALNTGIAELFWNGFITNDVFKELQGLRRSPRTGSASPVERIELVDPRHNPRKPGIMHSVRKALRQVPGWSGRWSLVHTPSVLGKQVPEHERVYRQALLLLDRYGIVAREFHRHEDLLPWPAIATTLQQMEMKGEVRRGYFIEGLSGMQFALPSAVDALRSIRSTPHRESSMVLLNMCDPANPYGYGFGIQDAGGNRELRIARSPSSFVVFEAGKPVLAVENGGTRLWTLGMGSDEKLKTALLIFIQTLHQPAHFRAVKSITIEQCDGIRPVLSPLRPVLQSLGFVRGRNQTMVYEGYV